ncbi:MAG: repeat-containing protein [Rhodospirillales bacterium]|nr:repeat-containing protein [Rhodospirillales bacterium]
MPSPKKPSGSAGATDRKFAAAVAKHQAGDLAAAEAGYRAILAAQPRHVASLCNLGVLLRATGRAVDAVACYLSAIAASPSHPPAYENLGNALIELGELAAAEAAFRKATMLAPRSAEAFLGLGNARHRQGRLDAAMADYERALALQPGHPQALLNAAAILQSTGRLPAAAGIYRQLIAAHPRFAKAYCNLGAVLEPLGELGEAAKVLETAMALQPNYAAAMMNVGTVLQVGGDVAAALAVLRRALAIAPEPRIHSNLLMYLNYRPDVGDAAIAAEHREWDRLYARPVAPDPPVARPSDPARHLRIGFVSADFRTHSVSYFLEPLLAHRDRAAAEIFLYSDVAAPDATSERLAALADHLVPILGHSDDAVAARVQADGIDILVDLAGHSGANRLMLFARKPAPVQASWLGYPNTTGLAAMDFRITDSIADPPSADALHSETLIRLADGFLCYQPPADAPAVAPLPALAARQITFGSFNNLAKVTPEVVRCWAAILGAVPGSRLILKSHSFADAGTSERYRGLFAASGIAAERLDLLPRILATDGHLAAYHRIDIGLDPFPYNGTTTSCEALWMGVPVMTLAGTRHAGRVGASLLSRLGLDALVATDEAEYVATAARLAGDLPGLAALRGGLRERMRRSKLCDAAGFAREMEGAFLRMWQSRIKP